MEAPSAAQEIKAAIAAVLAFGSALWGWVGWVALTWIAAMVLDYLTGSWAAAAAGEWSSKIARQGLWHKLGEVVAVLVGGLCDVALHAIVETVGAEALPFTYKSVITPIICLWYIFTELGSIIENADKLGAPVPSWLKKMISKTRDSLDKKTDEAVGEKTEE